MRARLLGSVLAAVFSVAVAVGALGGSGLLAGQPDPTFPPDSGWDSVQAVSPELPPDSGWDLVQAADPTSLSDSGWDSIPVDADV
jgi:hypothetical protein